MRSVFLLFRDFQTVQLFTVHARSIDTDFVPFSTEPNLLRVMQVNRWRMPEHHGFVDACWIIEEWFPYPDEIMLWSQLPVFNTRINACTKM